MISGTRGTSQTLIKDIKKVLEKKGFQTVVLNSDKEVKDFINEEIPDETTAGLGDSITTCKLKVRNLLAAKGVTIFYAWDGSENYNRSLDTFEAPERPDYYISRVTALTYEGRILMKDYNKKAATEGNFPKNVYAFAGLNRLVDELTQGESLEKYPVISTCPPDVKFTVALLPFLDY